MRKRCGRSVAAALIVLGGLAAGGCESGSDWVRYEVLAKGFYSKFEHQQPNLYVFSNPKTWEEFRDITLLPDAPGRGVDIEPGTVLLAIFRGQQPTGGYEVTLKGVRVEGNTVNVIAIMVRPEPGAVMEQSQSSAYLVAKLGHRIADLSKTTFQLLDERYQPIVRTRVDDPMANDEPHATVEP